MGDAKIRCALAYRIDGGSAVCLAKYDHANEYEASGGAGGELYGGKNQDYAAAVAKVIENDPPSGLSEAGTIGGFKVVQSDMHQVIYGADTDAVCLAVITGLKYPSRVAIKMLQELYKDFMDGFGSSAKTAAVNSLTKKAKNTLKDACTKYDDLSKVDKASTLLGKVDEVKSSMQSNIANMLKNTEKAESLAEKSDQLNEQASVFKKRSTSLKQQMAWKNMKMTLLLGGLILVILIVILAPVINAMKN
ncbi:vesicle-associated membrane protein 7 [Fistulifera solaris]|uniref:Vesicle-associated membrane protein 7 n=1 Tax=Fistulifera solaris TaxID=1519565 RepID=A0A1Z5KEL0_FISSO|nr:vesicle-associated membrane protein 7 [Fistulifera solaris]|eukprot:GAX24626.1 vesicle-associated membrane protein 7 [Fistulifera solaris]